MLHLFHIGHFEKIMKLFLNYNLRESARGKMENSIIDFYKESLLSWDKIERKKKYVYTSFKRPDRAI